MLLAPLLLGRQLVGILTLDYGAEVRTFAHAELALAGGVARLAAVVLERDRLLGEREEARASALALTEANRRMDEFLGIATHELKTPVTSSSLVVQLAAFRLAGLRAQVTAAEDQVGGAAPADAIADELNALQALLARAEDSMDRLSRLVVDLLDVTRIRAGMLQLRLAPCDITAVVREAVAEQRQLAPGRVIELRLPVAEAAQPVHATQGAEPPVWVTADADRIGQVVTNYLSNALKYAPEDRPVTVRLRTRGDWVRLLVCDEGPGLPPAEHAHIWDPFHRAAGIEVLSGTGVGLGLGLHISRTIIERHRGRVGVRSALGKGATFWFALPITPGGAESAPAAAAPAPS
jgi:signal transduction histidine kinase